MEKRKFLLVRVEVEGRIPLWYVAQEINYKLELFEGYRVKKEAKARIAQLTEAWEAREPS